MKPLRHFRRSIAALALPLGLVACAAADLSPVQPAPSQALSGPALWKVSDPDTVIYLFGTVHALPPDIEWFSGPVERAFHASEELVTEIEISDPAVVQQAIMSRSLLPEGQNLRRLMTEQDRIQFEEALISAGLPVDSFDRLKPWFAAMTLSLMTLPQSGYATENGVEAVLNDNAVQKEKVALETVEEQIELFDGLPKDAQLVFLDRTIESMPDLPEGLARIVAEWIEGDADELARLLNAELADPVLRERLLTRRNANWARWIDARLAEPGTVFVAVGAGHLAGHGSVQDYLADLDLEAVRVFE